MSKSDRNNIDWLLDILDSIEKILRYTDGMTYQDFTANELVVDAVLRNFGIIGEAANNLGENFHEAHPEIEWRLVINFRHRVVHHYFGMDDQIVWEIIEDELPKLERKINEIVSKLETK
jgi:uncharacterized protein with HEPN domain